MTDKQKNLYEEADLNNFSDNDDDDDDEIIDNNDGGFEDDIINNENVSSDSEENVKSEEEKTEDNKPPLTLTQQVTAPNQIISKTENEKREIDFSNSIKANIEELDNNLDQYTKEDWINLLINDDLELKDDKDNVKLSLQNQKNNIGNNIKSGNSQQFNTAWTNWLSKMVKQQPQETNQNQEIFDLLLNDREVIEEEINNYNENKKVDISSKVKSYLEKREKNWKDLENKVAADWKQKCTFTPNTQQNTKKRKWDEFLKDQDNYQKKIQEKLLNLKDHQEQKEKEELKNIPKICTTSNRIANEKNKGEKAYKRLYHSEKIKQEEKVLNSNNSNKKQIPRNPQNEEKFKQLYNDAKLREIKTKEKEDIENKKLKENWKYKSNMNSNKYLYNKFKAQFKLHIESVLNCSSTLILKSLKDLYKKWNFYSDVNKGNNQEIEDELWNTWYETWKDENNQIKIDQLFVFSWSILNLFEYYIISNYKIPSAQQQIKVDTPSNKIQNSRSYKNLNSDSDKGNKPLVTNKSSQKIEVADNYIDIAKRIDAELNLKIVTNKRYGGYDSNNNFIITIASSRVIFKDFSLFYQNYNKGSNSNTGTNSTNIPEKKILKKKTNETNKRIEQWYLESAKKKNWIELQSEQHNQQKEKEQLQECTFKPKINAASSYSSNIYPIDSCSSEKQRIEWLYKKGTEMLLNKKEKTPQQLELERNIQECTFKPEITKVKKDVFENKNREVLQDDVMKKYSQRLQNGRKEKEFRNSIFERGEYMPQPREFSEEKRKNNRSLSNGGSFAFPNSSNISGINNSKALKGSFVQSSENSKIKEMMRLKAEEEKPNVVKKTRDENEAPILQIDINWKHGVKKKIYVYEDDTAENLANAFTIENNLDSKTRKKLQKWIQMEMDKLLTKIEEEKTLSKSWWNTLKNQQ